MDVEIYVRDISPADAIAWMQQRLGPLVPGEVVDGIHYLRVDGAKIAVVITPNIEDGPFLSIFVNGADVQWARSEELAAPCAKELQRVVRWCDETTNGWMERVGDEAPRALESIDEP